MFEKSDTKSCIVDACSGRICEKSVQPRTVTDGDMSNLVRFKNTKRPSAALTSSTGCFFRVSTLSLESLHSLDCFLPGPLIFSIWLMIAKQEEDGLKLAQLCFQKLVESVIRNSAYATK